jgi:hypothetical protein
MDIDKRRLICGEGRLGETQIDQRANSPTFRISRTCVIHNLDLDMTGFRECLNVGGSSNVHPLVSSCKIRCEHPTVCSHINTAMHCKNMVLNFCHHISRQVLL